MATRGHLQWWMVRLCATLKMLIPRILQFQRLRFSFNFQGKNSNLCLIKFSTKFWKMFSSISRFLWEKTVPETQFGKKISAIDPIFDQKSVTQDSMLDIACGNRPTYQEMFSTPGHGNRLPLWHLIIIIGISHESYCYNAFKDVVNIFFAKFHLKIIFF